MLPIVLNSVLDKFLRHAIGCTLFCFKLWACLHLFFYLSLFGIKIIEKQMQIMIY